MRLILEQELTDWKIVSSPLPENPAQIRVELFREYIATKFPDRYQKIKNINDEFGSLIEFLADINSLNVDVLKSDDFAEIKKAIGKRVEALKL